MGSSAALAHDHRSLFSAIGTWWKDFLAAREESEELQHLTHGDVERVAHDVGVSYDDLMDFARRGAHAADEAPEMLAALGVDADDLRANQHAVYVDIIRNCGHCSEKRACRHDLAAGTAEEHFHDYCLNAATIDALRAIAAVPPRQAA